MEGFIAYFVGEDFIFGIGIRNKSRMWPTGLSKRDQNTKPKNNKERCNIKKEKRKREKSQLHPLLDHIKNGGVSVPKLRLTFVTSWTIAYQTPLSMGFPRQEYWSGLPFPSPGALPDPGVEPRSPALQTNILPLSHQRKYFYEG